jgi:hypothetical protein
MTQTKKQKERLTKENSGHPINSIISEHKVCLISIVDKLQILPIERKNISIQRCKSICRIFVTLKSILAKP